MLRTFFTYLALLSLICCSVSVEEKDASAELNESDAPVLVHSVYFLLKDEITDQQESDFVDLLASFSEIDAVESVEIGNIAETGDARMGEFDIALSVVVSNLEKLKEYMDDPKHVEAKKKAAAYLKAAPVVYDYWSLD